MFTLIKRSPTADSVLIEYVEVFIKYGSGNSSSMECDRKTNREKLGGFFSQTRTSNISGFSF